MIKCRMKLLIHSQSTVQLEITSQNPNHGWQGWRAIFFRIVSHGYVLRSEITHPCCVLNGSKAGPGQVKTVQGWSGRGLVWTPRLAGISDTGPNSGSHGSNRSFLEIASVLVCRWRRSGHVNRSSAWLIPLTFTKLMNRNKHAFSIKCLVNWIKKSGTRVRYHKLTNYSVCCPPSFRVQVRRQPSWKICSRVQLSFGFWGGAVKAYDNFPESWHAYPDQYFWSFGWYGFAHKVWDYMTFIWRHRKVFQVLNMCVKRR